MKRARCERVERCKHHKETNNPSEINEVFHLSKDTAFNNGVSSVKSDLRT